MHFINTGNSFYIFPSTSTAIDTLPVQVYKVCFSKSNGLYLDTVGEPPVLTEKVYGNHAAKISKVMRAFNKMNRSLGVLLSGSKGTGKSLAMKMAMNMAVKEGYPVIIVDESLPGLVSFLNSIEQDVMVVFDEFEKVFDDEEELPTTQSDLLPLFDGISTVKQLRMLTVNDTQGMSDFFFNRPGRIHYHFSFDSMDVESYKDYLNDNMHNEAYLSDLDDIAYLSSVFGFSFDIMRAISQELNYADGTEPYTVVLRDLNISFSNDMELHGTADVSITLRDGTILSFTVPTSYYGEYCLLKVLNKYFTVGADVQVEMPGCQPQKVFASHIHLTAGDEHGHLDRVRISPEMFFSTRAENQFSKIPWDVNICLDKESLGTVAMGLEGNFTFDSTENTYVLDSSAIESVEVVFTPDFTHGNQPHFKAF